MWLDKDLNKEKEREHLSPLSLSPQQRANLNYEEDKNGYSLSEFPLVLYFGSCSMID